MSNFTTSNHPQQLPLSECAMQHDMQNNLLVVDFADLGSLNMHDLDRTHQILRIALQTSGPNDLEVFLKAQRAGASLVGILVSADVQARLQGGQMRLRSVAPGIREILLRCGLQRLIATTV